MTDAREDKRIRAIKGARAIIASSGTGFDCVIRDMSGSGARIEFSDFVALRDKFELLIKNENKIVPVRRTWQRGKQAGVSFDKRYTRLDRHIAA